MEKSKKITSIEYEINEPVHVVDYNPLWPQFFNKEKEYLQKIFGSVAIIEHFGSTSIPGIKSKPIVDILIGLPTMSLNKRELSRLLELEYKGFGEAGVPGRLYFVKRSPLMNYNLAITEYDSKLWQDNILLRDYLRAHSDTAREYSLLKEHILASGSTTLLEYSELKHDFVRELLKKVHSWAEKQ